MKRHGFHGGPRTHGQSDRERAPGAIAQGTSPGRVWKGKKMAGHMGNEMVSILGVQVVKIDKKSGEVWITGSVPGGRSALVKLTKIKSGKFVGLRETENNKVTSNKVTEEEENIEEKQTETETEVKPARVVEVETVENKKEE